MQLARWRLDYDPGSTMFCKSLTKASTDQPANREALTGRTHKPGQQGLFAY